MQGLHDSQRNEDCFFQIASDGATRCLPTLYAFGSFFADPACTVPAGYYYSGCAAPPYISVPASSATCPVAAGPSFYMRGSAITTGYSKNGANCTATTLSPTLTMYTSVGAAIPPASFVAATLTVE